MANVLTVPASGAIIFDNQTAGSSTISPLSSAPRLQYDNAGGLNITSYTTGASAIDRFSVDGANGRLFSVSDSLTGVIFSVNDAAGLPIIEVNSTTTDVVNIGTYGTNALVVSGSNVGIGTATPSAKLSIVDTTLAGSGSLSGSALNIAQTWNTTGTPTAIKLNVTDTASNAASLLMDLQVGGFSRFAISKNGGLTFGSSTNPVLRASVSSDGAGRLLLNSSNISGIVVYGSTQLRGALNFFDGAFLQRDNVGENDVIAQRNGVNAQESRIYGTYANSGADYRRLALKMSTAGVAQIVAEGLGSGALGNVLQLPANTTFADAAATRTALGVARTRITQDSDFPSSSSTFADTDLTVSLTGGVDYLIRGVFDLVPGSSTSGAKLQIATSQTIDCLQASGCAIGNVASSAGASTIGLVTTSRSDFFNYTGATLYRRVQIEVRVKLTATGDFKIRFAQVATEATASLLKAGSFLTVETL
jgi:hypothetical protein